MTLPNPVLYILARSDLESLNPGKLAAQACHASNIAQTVIEKFSLLDDRRSVAMVNLWNLWSGDRGYGTTIVLDVPTSVLTAMNEKVNGNIFNWEDNRNVIYGTVVDPSYPVRDGAITHLVPLLTCGFVFGDKSDFNVSNITSSLNLYA